MTAINQAHEDRGYDHPALGHYFRLDRAGWRELEGVERDDEGSRSTRMPVPAEVMFDILWLGLTTNDDHNLRQCACLVLCYSWFNCANSGVLLLRRHVTFDARGITVNVQGKTLSERSLASLHSL
jgi:hypothetical protein